MTFSDLFKVTMIQRHNYNLKMIQHTKSRYSLTLTMALQWPTNKKSYDLSNGAIFSDLERLLPPVSRSRRFLTLNISETVRHTDIDSTRRWHVTISCQPDRRPPQPVRPWKSGRVHLAEGSNVVVLELPYSTEFGRESGKFASWGPKIWKIWWRSLTD